MKKAALFLSLFIIFTCLANNNSNAQNKLKRYNVESGIIQYKSTTSGKILGSTVTGSGTESVSFKDWGAIELLEEKSSQTTTTKIFRKSSTKTETVHTMNKLDNGKSYSVDFDKKEIYLRRDMAMDMTSQFHPDADAGEVGMGMLESMGGEKIGDEKFLGYDCEIWNVLGAKQWMYKGVVLRLEMTMMAITTIKEATEASFNVSVPGKNFELPNFKIIKEEGFSDDMEYEEDMEDMDEKMDKLSKMSFEEWKKMAVANDEELKEMSDEKLRQTYDMMQKMIKMRQNK